MENWKDINGYEGLYQISDLGRVKSLARDITGEKNGKNIIIRKQSEEILKLPIKKGYYQIRLCKNGTKKWFHVHRLVANTFLNNPNNYPQINHIDENKLNNNVNNLEWCTASYNNNYGSRLQRVSENNKLRKEVIKYDLDGNYIEEYKSLIQAAVSNNISPSSVSLCCNHIYKQVKGNIYKFKKRS